MKSNHNVDNSNTISEFTFPLQVWEEFIWSENQKVLASKSIAMRFVEMAGRYKERNWVIGLDITILVFLSVPSKEVA